MDFYCNKFQSVSYHDLISEVSKRYWVDSEYFAKNYFEFIINVIVAIINDIDLTLVDYRNEISSNENRRIEVATKEITNVEFLIKAIKASKSKIGIYSSGTTSDPKLIFQPVDRLLKSVRISEEHTNSKWGFTYNPSHSAGIQVFLQAICNRAELIDLYKYNRSDIISTCNNKGITHISATPTFYRMLAPYDFSFPSIKSITFNGEKSSTDLIQQLKSVCPNARFRNIYGSTESGPLMSSESNTFKIPERLKGKIKIENNELLIKSELISNSVDSVEWYQTGDLVELISEDPLTIEFLSRKTRILNVGGQNVNPAEVEDMLILHPDVKDARVYGRSNKLIGNLVVAEIQPMNEKTISEKEIIEYCKGRLAKYKVPRMIKWVNEIKVGRTGKKSI